MTTLANQDLPGFFKDADVASTRGQSATLAWSRLRLSGALIAALGGALSWQVGKIQIWGCVALAGFAAAFVAEICLIILQPERDWYSGRALAESAKTLAWRFAVIADPFLPELDVSSARRLMRERLALVADKGRDRITLRSGQHDVTDPMLELRTSSFETRKATYLSCRIDNQISWYSRNAEINRRRALRWRVSLIIGEVIAIVLAAGRAFGVWDIDFSGILAAAVASGAAWLGLKQHSALASAYSVAASELSLSRENLALLSEEDWPFAVADAEEAISREHTMWLASRTGVH